MIARSTLAGLALLLPLGPGAPSPAGAEPAAAQGGTATTERSAQVAARAQGRPSQAERSVWRDDVTRRVRERWERAVRGNWALNGIVVVRFAVMSDGRVTDVEVAQGSGDAAIDRLAVGAIEALGSLPPPPTGRAERVVAPLRVVGRGGR